MATRSGWTREQLLVAYWLYAQLPFGKLHQHNPLIIDYAAKIGRTPSALAMKLSNIASLDPAITQSGRAGLAGASTSDRAMWEEMQADWDAFAQATTSAVAALSEGIELENAEAKAEPEPDYSGRTEEREVSVRVGQSFFRRAVLSAYQDRCAISGLAVPRLLVASHIVPWRVEPKHRLNPRNGICLSVLHDKAFDSGMLTISAEMTVKVATRLLEKPDSFFANTIAAFHGSPICQPEKFAPSEAFLDFHRSHVFAN